MKTNQYFFPILIVSLVITAITLGCLFIHYGAKDVPFDAKQYALENHCPYEFGECPSAQQMHHEDSLAYADVEYVMDSLQARIIQLETQLAGYEFKNHSQILKAGITRITRDERGLLSVEFKRGNKEYALDYITDTEFQYEFGFSVK
jgi:hypothetical protein